MKKNISTPVSARLAKLSGYAHIPAPDLAKFRRLELQAQELGVLLDKKNFLADLTPAQSRALSKADQELVGWGIQARVVGTDKPARDWVDTHLPGTDMEYTRGAWRFFSSGGPVMKYTPAERKAMLARHRKWKAKMRREFAALVAQRKVYMTFRNAW